MDKETKELLEEMKNCTGFVSVSDLAERFAEVDEYYNHEPWNLKQILNNIHILIPVELNERR